MPEAEQRPLGTGAAPKAAGPGRDGTPRPVTDNPILRRVYDALIARGSVWREGTQDWTCPAHDDENPSLGVAEGETQPVVMMCHAGCSYDEVVSTLGLSRSDLAERTSVRREVARSRYVYASATGVPLYEVVRIDFSDGSKEFPQAPLDAEGNVLRRGKRAMDGVPLVLLNARLVRRWARLGKPIALVEGEKSAQALARRRIFATTAPGGANKRWRPEWTECLRGSSRVTIVADRDKAGYMHAAEVYDALKAAGIPVRIRVSATTGHHDDVVDHFDARHAWKDMVPLLRSALVWPEDATDDSADYPTSWLPLDLADALAGARPSGPTVLRRSDGKALLYPGQTHVVYGEAESMKSWFCLVACAEQIDAQRNVVYIDFEDDEYETVNRLRSLGLSDSAIKSHFHYVRPDEPLTGPHRDEAIDTLVSLAPTVIVLDGVTEGMELHGWDPLSIKDAAQWGRLPRTLARLGVDPEQDHLGPAVISIDHAPKDKDNRAGPIGSQHKKAGISGAAYYLNVRSPFGVGLAGVVDIHCTKDRRGRVREVSAGPKHDRVGSLNLTSDQATRTVDWSIEPARPSTGADYGRTELTSEIPSDVLETVSRAFEEAGPDGYSKNAVEMRLRGDNARLVRPAIEFLRNEGYLGDHPKRKPGGVPPLVSVKTWRRGVDDFIRYKVGVANE